MKLYEITSEILRRLSDTSEDDFDASELDKWDEALTGKLEGCARVIKNLASEETALREESQRLSERAAATKNRCQSLKDYVKEQLVRIGKRKIDAGIFKIRIQRSPLSIEIIHEEAIPDEFKERVSSWRIDKKGIAEYVKATGEVPVGVSAHQLEHIRIV